MEEGRSETKPRPLFKKPELRKYGRVEEATLSSNPSSGTNVACGFGGGCSTMFAGSVIPSICSYC